MCDLDHFKRVNDRYGHEVGDAVLARFGELLRELARDSDVPVRLGGEEFCMILPQTDRRGAEQAGAARDWCRRRGRPDACATGGSGSSRPTAAWPQAVAGRRHR